MAASDTAGLSLGKFQDEDVLYVTDPMSFAIINTTNGKTKNCYHQYYIYHHHHHHRYENMDSI